MTNQPSIQDVLFFPQMRPEKKIKKDDKAAFMALGMPDEWADIVMKLGFNTVEDLKKANPNKVHQDLCGYNKKNKLNLTNPTQDAVKGWIA